MKTEAYTQVLEYIMIMEKQEHKTQTYNERKQMQSC